MKKVIARITPIKISNGYISFQWQLRPEPNKPESPNNQQTTLGYTSVKIN